MRCKLKLGLDCSCCSRGSGRGCGSLDFCLVVLLLDDGAESGVPQGSIIGPLLFLIFINDIAVNISADTNIPLYADDAKYFREF